jgi:hypothetical protein
MSSNRKFEVLRKGRWVSGGVRGYVWIVRQDWDYFHEDFYDEGPDLSMEGWAYYALYGQTSLIEQHSSRSPTCLSEVEAADKAERSFDSLEWEAAQDTEE